MSLRVWSSRGGGGGGGGGGGTSLNKVHILIFDGNLVVCFSGIIVTTALGSS